MLDTGRIQVEYGRGIPACIGLRANPNPNPVPSRPTSGFPAAATASRAPVRHPIPPQHS